MAIKLFLVSFLILAALEMDMYSAIKIKIEPETFDKEKGTTVEVTCKVDDAESEAKEISLMKIARKGERGIVLLHRNNSVTYVSGNAEEFPAKGYVYKDVSDTNLQMTITTPDPEDSGVYICLVQYTDGSGDVKEHKATGHLNVEAAEVKMLNNTIKKLLEKVEREKGDIKKIEKKEAEDKKKVVDLQDKSEKQTKDIETLVEKEAEVENKIKDLEQRTKDQIKTIAKDIDKNPNVKKLKDEVKKLVSKVKLEENDIKELSQTKKDDKNKMNSLESASEKQGKTIQSLKQKVSDVEKNTEDLMGEARKRMDELIGGKKDDLKTDVIELKHTISKQSERIDMLTKRTTKAEAMTQKLDELTQRLTKQIKKNDVDESGDGAYTSLVAFHVTSDTNNMYPIQDQPLKYTKVILNEGKGYDTQTGIFTAPRDGVYAFHLTLQITCAGCRIEVTLVANTEVLSRFTGGGKYDIDQHSTNAVVKLRTGDKVKAVAYNVVNNKNKKWSLGFSQKSSFSGYLILSP